MKVTPIVGAYSFNNSRDRHYREDSKTFSDLVKSHMKQAFVRPQ